MAINVSRTSGRGGEVRCASFLFTCVLLFSLMTSSDSIDPRRRFRDDVTKQDVKNNIDTTKIEDVTTRRPNSDDVTTAGYVNTEQSGKLILTASCSDYPSCQPDLQILQNAIGTDHMEEACRHVSASFQCQKSATKLCEQEGKVDKEGLMKMRKAYIYSEIFMQEMCHPGYSPDNTVTKGGSHCSEFRSCFVDVKRYKAAAKSQMYFEACSIATHIYKCSTSAMLDCKIRGALSYEALDFMEGSTVQAGIRVDSICAFTTTTTPVPQTISYQCFDYAECPNPDLDVLQTAQRTGLYDDACKTLIPHTKCVEEAITDCEKQALVSGIALQSMRESLAKARKTMETYCPFYESEVIKGKVLLSGPVSIKGSPAMFNLGTTSPPVTCFNIASCPKPAKTPLGQEKDYHLACKTMKIHTACIDFATNDCKVRNLISGPALDAIVKGVAEARHRTQEYCKHTKDDNPDNGSPTRTADLYLWILLTILVLYYYSS